MKKDSTNNKKTVSNLLILLILVGAFLVLRGAVNNQSSNFKDADFESDALTAQAGCSTPTLSNIVATPTTTSVTITWTTNKISNSNVRYGLSTASLGAWSTTISDAGGTNTHSYTLSGLTPGTAYNYRVRSQTVPGGCQRTSSTYTFTTPAVPLTPDITAPSVPTSLAASNVTSSSATLTWGVAVDPTIAGATTSGVAGYEIYGPTSACNYGGIVGYCGMSTGTSLAISGLIPSKTYTGQTGAYAGFTVLAYDLAGNYSTAVSPWISLTTPSAVDTTAPTATLTAPASGATLSGTTTLSATATDGVGVTQVRFYDGTNLLSTDATAPTWTYAWNTTTATNGTHSLTAKAYDAAGNIGTSSVVSVTVSNIVADTTAPTAPTNLISPSKTSSTVNLSWTASTDNIGVSGYNVYVNNSTSPQNGSLITGTSYTVTSLSPSTAYGFTVKAKDAAGNMSAASNLISITTSALADTTPPVLSSIQAASITQTGATVSWTTNETATTVVEYGTTTSYGQTVNNPSLSTAHSTTLSGLTASTMYHYRVKSADAAGNLTTSADYTFTTQAPVMSCANTSTTGYNIGMWEWKNTSQIVVAGSTTQTNLFNYVAAKNVNMLYLYTSKSFLQNTTNAANLRTFLNTAWNTHCLKVTLLDGAATWMFIPGNPYNTMGAPTTTAATDWINAVKTFNTSITGTGVHPVGARLDVEGHGSTYWNSYKTQVAQAILYMLDSVKVQLADTGLELSMDVARWIDTSSGLTAITYNGVTKNFMRHVFDRVDLLSIMDYVTNPATAWNDVLLEFQYGQSIGKQLVVGFETINLDSHGGGNGTTSFYGTSCSQLNSAMTSVYNSITSNGYSPVFKSFAIHMYKESNDTPGGYSLLCP